VPDVQPETRRLCLHGAGRASKPIASHGTRIARRHLELARCLREQRKLMLLHEPGFGFELLSTNHRFADLDQKRARKLRQVKAGDADKRATRG